jgi:peptidoglycan/LPS O-acetylase OafA/YrhL
LIANLFYWLTFRQLTGARLALLIFAAGVLFMVGANFVGTMDIGMRTSDFWWGIPRVTLTFFMGVALRRYFHERVSINLGNRAAVLALVSLILVFSMSRELEWRHGSMVAGFAMLIVVFPALLLVVAGATPGPRVGALCRWTGDASYPVYLLQTPLMGVAAAIPQVVWGRKAAEFIPWIGIAFIVGTILISLWVDRRFELPLRKWLKARWQRFSKPLP